MEKPMSHKRYTKEFKEEVLRHLGQGEPAASVARRYQIDRSLLYDWDAKRKDGALQDTFSTRAGLERQIAELQRKLGELAMENDFLKRTLRRLEQRYPLEEETGGRKSSAKSKPR
jgi:transposase-like protein